MARARFPLGCLLVTRQNRGPAPWDRRAVFQPVTDDAPAIRGRWHRVPRDGAPREQRRVPDIVPQLGTRKQNPPRGRTRQSLPRSGRMASFENVSAGGRTRPGLERIRRCAEERGPDPGRRPPPDGRMLRRTWPRRLPGPGRGGRLGGRRFRSERGSSLDRKCTAARLGAEQKCALLSNGPRRAPRGYTRGKGVQWASERAETSTTGNRSE